MLGTVTVFKSVFVRSLQICGNNVHRRQTQMLNVREPERKQKSCPIGRGKSFSEMTTVNYSFVEKPIQKGTQEAEKIIREWSYSARHGRQIAKRIEMKKRESTFQARRGPTLPAIC